MTIYRAHLWEFQAWGKSRHVLMCARYYSWKLCAVRMRNAVLRKNLNFVSSPSKRQVSSTSITSGTRDWYEIQSFFPCRHRSAFYLNDDIYKTSQNLTNQRHYPVLLWVNNNDTLRAWGIIRLCNRPSVKKEKYSRRSLIRSLTSEFQIHKTMLKKLSLFKKQVESN